MVAVESRRIFFEEFGSFGLGGDSGELRKRLLERIFREKLEAGGGFSS